MKYTLWVVVTLLMCSCSDPVRLSPKNPKTIFMEEYMPEVKDVRDLAVVEYESCLRNLDTLNNVWGTLRHVESKQVLQEKINQIRARRTELLDAICSIDIEVEKGIATKAIMQQNTILNLSEKIESIKNVVITAKTLNSNIQAAYAEPHRVIPLAIPVYP